MDVGALVNLLGSIPLVLLGAYVAWLRPRSSGKTAFGLFMLVFGVTYISNNLFVISGQSTLPEPSDADRLVRTALVLLSLPLLAIALWRFPRSLGPADRGAGIVLGILSAVIAASVATAMWIRAADPGPEATQGTLADLNTAVAWVQHGAMAMYAAFLAFRFVRASDPVLRRQCALLAAGLATFTAFVTTAGPNSQADPFATDGVAVGRLVTYGTMLAAVLAAWARALFSPDARVARNVLLWTAVVPVIGAWYALELDYNGVYGVVRFLSFCILTYAIVKYQLLGIDVKVRLAIKGSTLAAMFIGVFFVVSEIAQQFFGARYENQYLGIAAAGGLVFAMAPLQRIAERVAHKAVPTLGPVPAEAGVPTTAVDADFRAAFTAAMGDGRITDKEEMALARLADRLRVPAATLVEMRQAATGRRRR